MNDTPRTDKYSGMDVESLYVTSADFSRQLERELNAANAKIAEMQKLLVECSSALGGLAASKVCEAAHHDAADQHWLGEKCPVEIRFCKIYESVSEFLEKEKLDITKDAKL